MRGIVILEVLRQIQQELGGRIQVQEFFDLIVGTRLVTLSPTHFLFGSEANFCSSTGGILALGLGVKNWSVSRCTELFLRMVEKAFTPKFFGGVTLGTTKYRTQPLEDAFSESFKEEAMFGGVRDGPLASARKVAVTSATETAEQAVIFTNYNRADDEQSKFLTKASQNSTDALKVGYQLVRPDDPKNDILIREA